MKSGAPYWPEHADQPFGDVLNSIKKYVVSDTLTSAERENSEILSGDVASKVAELKAQESGDHAYPFCSAEPLSARRVISW